MLSEIIEVKCAQGLHMRPAAQLAGEMMKFSSRVTLRTDNKSVDAKSILSIMAAGIKRGCIVTVECSGSDEQQALDSARAIITSEDG